MAKAVLAGPKFKAKVGFGGVVYGCVKAAQQRWCLAKSSVARAMLCEVGQCKGRVPPGIVEQRRCEVP